jgi:hypothetical protein
MATRKPRRFGSGGETADKEEGLKASKDEKVGFLERLRMGNIDEEGSEAYNRFGAGRGRAERAKNVPVEDRVATPVKREKPQVEAPKAPKADEDEMEAANKREPIAVSAGKKAEPDAPAKEARKPAAKNEYGAAPKSAAKNAYAAAPKRDTSNYSNEGRSSPTAKSSSASSKPAKSLVDQIPLDAPRTPVKGEKIDSSELGRNIGNALNATPGIQAVGRLKSAGQAAQKAGSRALSTSVDDGVTYLGKSGRRQVGGFDEVGSSGARQLANNPTRQLPAPPKQLSGPSKGELVARDRAARAAKRRAEMGQDNASRYGLDTKSSDYADRAKSIRDNLGGDDFTLGMKRGGKVKSSASKPAAKGWGMARGARAAKMR